MGSTTRMGCPAYAGSRGRGRGCLRDVRERVAGALDTLDVLLLKERLDRLWHTMSNIRSNEREWTHTFLMSGILGAKRCEI